MNKLLVMMLVLINFLAGCGGVASPGGVPSDSPRTTIPTELVGSWYEGNPSTINYYDPVSGSWAPPNGSGFTYTFAADGRYEYSGLLQVSTYGCTSTLFGYYTGTVTLEGNVLTTYQNSGNIKYETNCGENSETTAEPEVTRFTWQLGPDEYGEETLTLIWPDGETSAFRRWQERI